MTPFTLTAADLRRGSFVASRARWLSRGGLVWSAIFLALVTALILLTSHRPISGRSFAVALVAALMAVAVLAALFMLAAWIWGGRLLKTHPHMRHQQQLRFDEDGFHILQPGGNWTHPWSDFTGLAEGMGVMVLMMGPSLFVTLPDRILTPEDRALIRRQMGHC